MGSTGGWVGCEDDVEEGVEGDPLSEPGIPFNFCRAASLFFFNLRAEVVYRVMSSCAGNLILVSILDAPMECSKRYHHDKNTMRNLRPCLKLDTSDV
jgi:hypothetical protein